MKVEPECVSCFFKMLAKGCELHGVSRKEQFEATAKLATRLKDLNPDDPPPFFSVNIGEVIKEITGEKDPYHTVKKTENDRAASLIPHIRNEINKSPNPLYAALKYAAAANVIDYGAPDVPELMSTLDGLAEHKFAGFDGDLILEKLKTAKLVLILGDNTGEIFFDRLLLEQLPKDKRYVYAVRSRPILNDSLLEDAKIAGIDDFAEIMESGSIIAGTDPNSCTEQFQKMYDKADIIISKGQGNFETLSDKNKPIFFLFAAKCGTVSKMLDVPIGSLMVIKSLHFRW